MFIGEIKFGEVIRYKDSYARVTGLKEQRGCIVIEVHTGDIWSPESCSPLTPKEKGELGTLFQTLESDRLDREI